MILPAQGVFTVTPPDVEALADNAGQPLPTGSLEFYMRKARVVICGNFQGKQAKEDSYAGGCQTDMLRAMLAHCAAVKWHTASTDIRNAYPSTDPLHPSRDTSSLPRCSMLFSYGELI